MTTSSDAPKRPSRPRGWHSIVAVLVVLAAIIGIAFRFARQTGQGVARATMPDRTEIVLKTVLFNPNQKFEVGVPTLGIVTPLSHRDTISPKTDQPLVRFVLSRRDPKTDDYLDFSWFSHLELTDRWGARVRSHFNTWGGECSSRVGTKQSLHPAAIGKPIPERDGYRFVVANMHRFEIDGNTTEVRVVDLTGAVVGTLKVPVPAEYQVQHARPDLRWQQTIRGVQVRLDSMKMVGGSYIAGARVTARTTFVPKYTVLIDGKVVDQSLWRDSDMVFTDACGNLLNLDDAPLPDGQPSWELQFMLFRRQSVGFDESYPRTGLGDCPIPANAVASVELAESSFVTTATLLPPNGSASVSRDAFGDVPARGLTADWVCGTRAKPFDYMTSAGGSPSQREGHYRVTTEPNSKYGRDTPGVNGTLHAEWNELNRNTLVSTECQYPILLLTTHELASNEAINIVAEDDQGRSIPVHPLVQIFKRMPAYACEVRPDSKSLTFSYIIQQGRPVSLVVPPPTRGLQLSKPMPAGLVTMGTEDGGTHTTGGWGIETAIEYTLNPDGDSWKAQRD